MSRGLQALGALRHHRKAPALEQDGRAEAALELEELADRGDRDPPLLDPDGAPVADDLALDEPRPRARLGVGVRPDDGEPYRFGTGGSLPMRSAASRSFPPMVWA